jgi:hypothetical protein
MHELLVKKAAPLSDDAKDRLGQHGDVVVEERAIGDYEFFLVQNRYMRYVQLGMQRVGQDMTNIEEQTTKIPQEKGKFSMSELKSLLNEWVFEYEKILIGTYEPRKRAFYAKIIRALGFKLGEMMVAGHSVLVLNEPADSE